MPDVEVALMRCAGGISALTLLWVILFATRFRKQGLLLWRFMPRSCSFLALPKTDSRGALDANGVVEELIATQRATAVRCFIEMLMCILFLLNFLAIFNQFSPRAQFIEFAEQQFRSGQYLPTAILFPIIVFMWCAEKHASCYWIDLIHLLLLLRVGYETMTADKDNILFWSSVYSCGRFCFSFLGTFSCSCCLNVIFAFTSIAHKRRMLKTDWLGSNLNIGNVWMTEIVSVVIILGFSRLAQVWKLSEVRAQVKAEFFATAEKTARSMLLGLCDVVLHVSSERGLPIMTNSPQLEALLFRQPPNGFASESFLKFVEAADHDRLLNSLSAGSDPQRPLMSLPLSLLDCRNAPVRVQLFHVCCADLNGQRRYLVGIREEGDDDERSQMASRLYCENGIVAGSNSVIASRIVQSKSERPAKISSDRSNDGGGGAVSNCGSAEASCCDDASVRDFSSVGSHNVRSKESDVPARTETGEEVTSATCWFEAADPAMTILRCSPNFQLLVGSSIQGLSLGSLMRGDIRLADTVRSLVNEAASAEDLVENVTLDWVRLLPSYSRSVAEYAAVCTLSILQDDGGCHNVKIMASFSNISIIVGKTHESSDTATRGRALRTFRDVATVGTALFVAGDDPSPREDMRASVLLCL
eukprot:TRINITY_DN15341_c0_g1_i1.p1 TRINITY_DN15341_c0_g1~~TRINITY_DN15341_c0_g1_i1.p1  ORF type:complete len:657 (+),score=72.02 TRINITY_DN15341_c0_g1_i1:45-1973(+)